MEFTQDAWINLPRSDRFNRILELGFLIALSEGLGKSPKGDMPFHQVGTVDFEPVYGRAKSLFCGSRAVRDPDMINFIDTLNPNLFEINQDTTLFDRLSASATTWLVQSRNITLWGLEKFDILVQAGTENTIKEFCLNNRNRRIRIKKGEWWYVTAILDSMKVNWKYLEDDDLLETDALIMSVPFFGNFAVPEDYDELMVECCDKFVPVMLDLCWSSLCYSIGINIHYPCIDVCSFTIGKLFPLEQIRLGFRLVRPGYVPKFDEQYNQFRLTSWLTIVLLQNFEASYIVDKYRLLQFEWRDRLGLHPTNCVLSSILPDDALWWNQHRTHGGLYPQNQFSMVSLYENENLIQEHCSWIQEGIN